MILESWVWKKELKKEFRKFTKLINSDKNAYINEDCSEEEYFSFNLKVEKFFFTSFFIIRKLLEAKKLSDSICAYSLHCFAYPKIPRTPKLSDYYGHACDIHKNYDINNPINVTLTIRDLCNIFIHSYIFTPCIEESSFNHILINSTKTKNKYCYLINIDILFRLIISVTNDDVVRTIMRYDKNTDSVIIHNYTINDVQNL